MVQLIDDFVFRFRLFYCHFNSTMVQLIVTESIKYRLLPHYFNSTMVQLIGDCKVEEYQEKYISILLWFN